MTARRCSTVWVEMPYWIMMPQRCRIALVWDSQALKSPGGAWMCAIAAPARHADSTDAARTSELSKRCTHSGYMEQSVAQFVMMSFSMGAPRGAGHHIGAPRISPRRLGI